MHSIAVENLRTGYLEIVDYVLRRGTAVAPRGQKTLELNGPATICITNPRDVVPLGVNRNPNLAIGAAESCHLIGGVSDAKQMVSVAKNFGMFVEEGRLRGAYGPRLFEQFPRVAALLKKDPDTRQAGVTLWRHDELATPSKDVPCTMSLFFHIRHGKLNLSVTMRSNDIFWGLPYDAWMFSNALHAMAYAIDVPVGVYYHTALSLHAYIERDGVKLRGLIPTDFQQPVTVPMLVDDLWDLDGDLRQQDLTPQDAAQRFRLAALFAKMASLNADTVADDENTPASVRWYAQQLRNHVSHGALGPDGYVM